MKQKIVINGETAIKPYFYIRNGLLHVRYTVDRCIELSFSERERIKAKVTENPGCKQEILLNEWSFQTECVGKPVIFDGIAEIDKRIKGSKNENGFKN